ncbi:hypothetical protein FGADI_12120 [Fusarium gaditjirri]|uniref:Uncharacterized protein n=1 Tax=Fusarium gaditjirri TaxID=282569 RepID=A0A8H4STH7_9HYPO|nr:hypothetical protein FGADI_12120 [Fusarium gaditjirri]
MGDLPPNFECIAEACATDIENMRRDMGKESLARNDAGLKKLQNTHPSVVNAISGVDTNDGINLKAGIPQHLNILMEDLLLGRMDFSGPQLYRILRTLDEICDEEFPKEQVKATSETGSMDESDTEFWFCEDWESFGDKLWQCKESLGLVSLLNHPEDPTPEARSVIIVLQKLILALKSASQQKTSGCAGVKRKVKDMDDEPEYRRKVIWADIKFAARQHNRYWLHDHIQQGLSFQSWAANDIRRSWVVIADNNPSRGCLSCNTLLQASPDALGKFPQKLFADEWTRLGDAQRGYMKLHSSESPASSNLQTNWIRRTG